MIGVLWSRIESGTSSIILFLTPPFISCSARSKYDFSGVTAKLFLSKNPSNNKASVLPSTRSVILFVEPIIFALAVSLSTSDLGKIITYKSILLLKSTVFSKSPETISGECVAMIKNLFEFLNKNVLKGGG